VFQAAKAITGGVIALKGQLIKANGHVVVAKGKLMQTKGEAISNFGKTIATHAFDTHHDSHIDEPPSAIGYYNQLPVTPMHQPTSKKLPFSLLIYFYFLKSKQTRCLQVMELLPRWDIRDKCTLVTCTRFPHIPATRSLAKRTPTMRTKLLLKIIRQDSQCHRPVTKAVLVTSDTVVTDLRQKERYKAHKNRLTIKRKVTVSKFVLKR
jgi:hypothetical protein